MYTGRPERLRTFAYLGLHRYFLTFCTFERRPLFQSAGVVDRTLSQILRAASNQAFAVLVYCFMPDHLHLLVSAGAESSDFKRFLTRAKQFSGYAHARAEGGRLWQRYSYEHVLRDDERTRTVARYILENPVRAGLVVSPFEYPFIGSAICSREDLCSWYQGVDPGRGSPAEAGHVRPG